MNSWFYFEVAHTPDNSISLCLGSLFFEFPESISKEKTIVIFLPPSHATPWHAEELLAVFSII
jgi:hypothetical protein